MAQQYPIWNEVFDDTYKTSKNFGSRTGLGVTKKRIVAYR